MSNAPQTHIVTKKKTHPAKTLLLQALFGFLATMAAGICLARGDAGRDQQYLQLTAELRSLSYRLMSLSRESLSGDEAMLTELRGVVDNMDNTWAKLRAITGANATEAKNSTTYESIWDRVQANAETLLNSGKSIIALNEVATTTDDVLTQLRAEHNNIVEIMIGNGAPANQVAMVQMQSWRVERMGTNIHKILGCGEKSTQSANQFKLDVSLFGKVLEGLKTGDRTLTITRVTDPEAIESLKKIEELFAFINSSTVEIVNASPALSQAQTASNALLDDSPQLLEALYQLSEKVLYARAREKEPDTLEYVQK